MDGAMSVRYKAYAKFVNHVLGACAALFELITGEPAPKLKDVLRGGNARSPEGFTY
jgi:hypothetical protein